MGRRKCIAGGGEGVRVGEGGGGMGRRVKIKQKGWLNRKTHKVLKVD